MFDERTDRTKTIHRRSGTSYDRRGTKYLLCCIANDCEITLDVDNLSNFHFFIFRLKEGRGEQHLFLALYYITDSLPYKN